MHQSKLIELLRKLPTRSLSRFREFLQSPYFNKNTENCLLFQYLLPYAPQFDAPALDRKTVLKQQPTNEPLDERSLAYRMNNLMQLLETFLAVEQLQEDPVEEQLSLMEAYHHLELPKHYNAALRRARRLVKKYPYRDVLYLRRLYRLAELENRHSERYERDYRPELQEAADALDQAYLAEKLRYSLEMANYSKVVEVEYQLNMGEAVLKWVKSRDWEEAPAINAYLYALQMLQEPENEQHFQQLRALLREHEALFPTEELRHFFNTLLNYCIRRINYQRDRSYYDHYLDINEMLLKKGMLLENGEIPPWRFNNLVTLGLDTGRNEWAYDFIQEYKALLPEAFREDIYRFNLGHYLYYQKEYDEAQRILNQVGLKDLLLAVATKNLLAKIYYETGQTELLISFLEAYRIYIYRQGLVKPKLKEQLRAFIDITRKMAKLAPFEKDKWRELADSLPPPGEVLQWEWLLKMLEKNKSL